MMLLSLSTTPALLHGLQLRRSIRTVRSCAEQAALQPAEVVDAQLRALQRGKASVSHSLMSPAYHERSDALERFEAWFDSPIYEPIQGCSAWVVKGAVTTREAPSETLLPDGRTFLASAPIEQVVRVEVTPGRSKWAETGITGARIGRALPTTTYEWTLSLQEDGRWTVDRIVPEAPLRVPASRATASDDAAVDSEEEVPTRGLGEGAVALVAAALLLTVGRWVGDQTGVFGASLDPAYWDEAPARTTLQNLLD